MRRQRTPIRRSLNRVVGEHHSADSRHQRMSGAGRIGSDAGQGFGQEGLDLADSLSLRFGMRFDRRSRRGRCDGSSRRDGPGDRRD